MILPQVFSQQRTHFHTARTPSAPSQDEDRIRDEVESIGTTKQGSNDKLVGKGGDQVDQVMMKLVWREANTEDVNVQKVVKRKLTLFFSQAVKQRKNSLQQEEDCQ